MRYFFDCEFIERGPKHPIELISIGMVAEDGREFYNVNRDFNPKHASPWVRDNVLPLLPDRNPDPVQWGGSPRLNAESWIWQPYDRIGKNLREFIGDCAPEFWTYYGAYDYVLLSQLMGGMSGWPAAWPYYARDLRQRLDAKGHSEIRQDDDAPHDALEDARWIRETFLTYRDRGWI